MGVVSAKKMLLKATEGKYAVEALNVTNAVQMKAVVEAAQGEKAPLILRASAALAPPAGPARAGLCPTCRPR
jgi:tagatose 1,6-diphosphate aldolase GatY/KbaY